MINRRYHLMLLLVLSMGLMGCSSGKSDNDRVLVSADNADEIADFNKSDISQVEIVTEQQTETEQKTEKQTEPETEKRTETEPLTEKQTEAPAPFKKEYDFSDVTVLSAVFAEVGGIGMVPYTNEIIQDFALQTRTQTILADNGTKVVLEADPQSGITNTAVTITIQGDDTENRMKNILLGFDNGITQDNLSRFMDGAYAGINAGVIGLASTSILKEEGSMTVVLKKAPFTETSEGVPFWRPVDLTETLLPDGAFRTVDFTEGSSDMLQILQGIDFGVVTEDDSRDLVSRCTTDEKGRLIHQEVSFMRRYRSTNGNVYEVSVGGGDENNVGITWTLQGDSLPTNKEDVLRLAEHIIKGMFDEDIDVSSELPLELGHIVVSAEDHKISIKVGNSSA